MTPERLQQLREEALEYIRTAPREELQKAVDEFNRRVGVMDTISKIEKSNDEKSCLNCGTSECELGNRARHGFCGNWTERK